jgi:hypothetical protein
MPGNRIVRALPSTRLPSELSREYLNLVVLGKVTLRNLSHEKWTTLQLTTNGFS